MVRSLLRYVAIRALLAVPTVFILLTTVFIIMRILPGDPVIALIGSNASPERIAIARHALGLDQPLHVQFFQYLVNIATGNLGLTVNGDRTIVETVEAAVPATAELATVAMLFAMLLGVGSGLIGARRGGIVDRAVRGSVLVGYSLPIFWVGLVLQIFFGMTLRIFPISGRISGFGAPLHVTGLYVLDSILAGNIVQLVDSLSHLVLPGLTLGFWIGAPISGMTRANLLKALNEDYVVTERALGLSENTIVYKYAFRNALLPVMAFLGLEVSILLGGSILVESVFGIPGIGNLLILAVNQRDFNLIQGTLAYITFIVVVVNILVDVACALIDPRVTL
jgi:peptide/nickel transport system permease protein